MAGSRARGTIARCRQMSDTMMLHHALQYQAIGWHIIPVHTIRGGWCSCRRSECEHPGKHPLTRNGLTDASNDPAQIVEWWTQWPDANIGVVTGALSGIVVADVDNHIQAQDFLQSHHWPDTALSRTGREGGNGRHIIWRHPGVPIKSRAGVIPGLDSRGEGGYIIAPPSIHASGARYEWIHDPVNTPLADCPDFWVDACRGQERKRAPASDYWPEGTRNNNMTSAVGKWRRADMDFDAAMIGADQLNRAKCSPPMAADEVERIVRSVYRYDVKTAEDLALEASGDETLRQWDASEQARIAELLKAKPKKAKSGQAPDCFLPPEGNLIGDGARWILRSSIRPQPLLAVSAMATFIGVVCGQRFATQTDLRTNLYMIGLAESGSGKDHARKCIKKLAAASNAASLIGGDAIASGTAMISALAESPRRMYLLDEFGLMLQSINGKNAGGYQRDIIKNLMELYSTANSVYHGIEYADRKIKKQQVIVEPCCCLYATSTHHTFYDALTGGDAASGAIARMIVVNDGEDRGKRQVPRDMPPPTDLINRINSLFGNASSGNLDDVPGDGSKQCTTRTVGMLDDVWDAYVDFDDSLTEYMTTPASRSVYSRVAENACKLALIYAIASCPDNPWIDHEAWLWGREVAMWCANYLMEQVQQHVADSDFERTCKIVATKIMSFGATGATRRDLSRALHLDKNLRDNVLEIIIEAGDIVVMDGGRLVHSDHV